MGEGWQGGQGRQGCGGKEYREQEAGERKKGREKEKEREREEASSSVNKTENRSMSRNCLGKRERSQKWGA